MPKRTKSPVPVKGSVQNLISKFDNQTGYVHNESVTILRRAKSLGSLNYIQPKQQVEGKNYQKHIQNEENLELTQIAQQINHLKNKLDCYNSYSKENHIYYQNQIVFILIDLANIPSGEKVHCAEHNFEMCEVLKQMTKKLNTLLPSMSKKAVDEEFFNSDVNGVNEKVFISKQLSKPKVLHEKQKSKQIVRTKSQEHRPPVHKVLENEEVEAAVSVRDLKAMFEKNSTVINLEMKKEFTKRTLKPSKSLGSFDMKYIPYKEKFNLDQKPAEKFVNDSDDDEIDYRYSNSKVDPKDEDEESGEEEEEEEASEDDEGSGNKWHDSDSEDSTLNGEDSENVDEEEQEE